MKLQLLTAAASIALLAVPTLASASDAGWYIRGNVGYGVITNVNFTGDLRGKVRGKAKKDNIAGSLGLGYEFGNNWRLELDASQLWNDLGAISKAKNTSSDMRIAAGMVNAIYSFSGLGSWQPYLGAGIGVGGGSVSAFAYSQRSNSSNVRSPTCPGTDVCTFRNTDISTAWQLLAGLGYKITDNLTWDTEYRYLDIGGLDFVGRGQNFQAGVLGKGSPIATSASGVGSHSILTGLRYRFGAKKARFSAKKKMLAPVSTPTMYSCWDGSRVLNLSACRAQPAKIVYTTCWDGSQVESSSACPARPMVQCWDGSSVSDTASCPSRPTITCWDGTISYDQASCPVQRLCADEYRQEIIYYKLGKPHSSEARAKIQNILDTSSNCAVGNINVIGHTDSSGSAALNISLSKRRASDVRSELIRQGVDSAIITSEGKGETQLFVNTGDGVKESLNRRTEIMIHLNSTGVIVN